MNDRLITPRREHSPALRISRAGPDQAGGIVELGRRTYAAHFADLWSADGLKAYLDAQFEPEAVAADLSGDQVQYWLAHADDGCALGYAKVKLDRPPPLPLGPSGSPERGLELEKIYLEPFATGRGYGSALIEQVMAFGRAADEPCVWLDVLKTNAGARRLYERHAFRVVGEVAFSTDRRHVGLWVMQRPL